jgi:REP element-mobilizing transposase RayT
MRSRYHVRDSTFAHFITGTVVEWLPVFTTATMCDLLVSSLRYSQEKKALQIFAWVILDNHFHAIVMAPNLQTVLAEFKRYTARIILNQLKADGREWLLNQLQYYCAAHKTASEHQVWQEGSHPQEIRTDEMMLQKCEYIRQNPVKRGLVVAPEHWRYSSAHEGLPESQPVLRCDPWR